MRRSDLILVLGGQGGVQHQDDPSFRFGRVGAERLAQHLDLLRVDGRAAQRHTLQHAARNVGGALARARNGVLGLLLCPTAMTALTI